MPSGFRDLLEGIRLRVGGETIAAELVAIAVATMLTGVAALKLDLFERLMTLTRRYEAYELDELVTIVIVLAGGLLLFSGRRIKELHAQVRQRQAAETAMRQMAMHDGLTGLPNRRYFKEHLERALDAARRGDAVSVLVFDLDHFKEVNDLLGHAAGDALLLAVTGRVRDLLRGGDFMARLGGDEFAIVPGPGLPPDGAVALACRLAEAMAEPFRICGNDVIVGASVGVTQFPSGGNNEAELLCSADCALYRAKAQGRGRYCVFEPILDGEVQDHRHLLQQLRWAIAKRDLVVLYQPRYDTATRQLRGFEALVRWDHPERGRICAETFVPLAEDCGLIVGLTDLVLQRACAVASTWPAHLRLAINLSRLEFRDERIVDRIAAVLAGSGLAADRLEIEVSEAVALTHSPTGRAALGRLQAMGVHITMDDFGTGLASVTSQQTFPFQRIKIDRSFIGGLVANGREGAIVTAIAGLGRALNLEVTAEGVETERQLAALQRLGCVEVQGFLLGGPADELAAAALARRQTSARLAGSAERDAALA